MTDHEIALRELLTKGTDASLLAMKMNFGSSVLMSCGPPSGR